MLKRHWLSRTTHPRRDNFVSFNNITEQTALGRKLPILLKAGKPQLGAIVIVTL